MSAALYAFTVTSVVVVVAESRDAAAKAVEQLTMLEPDGDTLAAIESAAKFALRRPLKDDLSDGEDVAAAMVAELWRDE